MLGNFSVFCSLLIFSKSSFSKNSFSSTIRVSNSSDPNQAQHFVRHDLGPKCLQRLSAGDTNKQRVKVGVGFKKSEFGSKTQRVKMK